MAETFGTMRRPIAAIVGVTLVMAAVHYAGWMIMALSLSLGYLCGRAAHDTRHVRRGLRERIVWLGSRDAKQIVMLGSAVFVMALALVLTMSRSGIVCFAGTEAVAGRFQQAADGYALKRAEPWLDAQVHYAEAHNDYLQVAAEGGLLLLVPAALALVAVVRAVRRRFLEAGDDTVTAWVRMGAVTALLAIALQEVADFSLQVPGNAALFTIVLAAALHRPVAHAR